MSSSFTQHHYFQIRAYTSLETIRTLRGNENRVGVGGGHIPWGKRGRTSSKLTDNVPDSLKRCVVLPDAQVKEKMSLCRG